MAYILIQHKGVWVRDHFTYDTRDAADAYAYTIYRLTGAATRVVEL